MQSSRTATRGWRVSGAIVSMALAAAAVADAPAGVPTLAQARNDTVWCHDEARSLVRRTARWQCEERVVSDEDATRIQQERRDRIKRVLQREREPIVPGKKLRRSGTGFFITTKGDVLTNHHVIAGCDAVTVSPAEGGEHVAEIRSADPSRDLALLETGTSTPGAALFRDFDEVVANEPVTVVGYPQQGLVVIKPVLVSGHVHPSAQPRSGGLFAMKIDVRPGNSGGPVVDEAGRVIGVVIATIDTPAVFAKTGKRIHDVGLAIRLDVVRDFVRPLAVDVTTTIDGTSLEQQPRFQRTREFVAQIRCWQ